MSENAHDPLADATLIFVAPRVGVSGVGDYAEEMLEQAKRVFGRVVQVRSGAGASDSIADVREARRLITEIATEAAMRGPVIVHSETSGAGIVPFWAMTARGLRVPEIVRTATVHDAPRAVWTPFRTRGVSRSRVLTHGIHLPFMWAHVWIERIVTRGVHLFALTPSGAHATERELHHRHVTLVRHAAPEHAEIIEAERRPLAVGMFGYVYLGKGFDQLERLRELIDPNIGVHVAGRGTENLPPIAGVKVLGPVDGASMDAFFAGIRAIVQPYSKRSGYGPEVHVASGVVAHAIGYRTPVIALSYPGLDDEAERIEGGVEELAAAVNRLIPNDVEVARLAARSSRLKDERTLEATFAAYAATWRGLIAGEQRGSAVDV